MKSADACVVRNSSSELGKLQVTSPLASQSNSGPTSSRLSAIKPSRETTAPIIALPMCISLLGRRLRPVGRGDALGMASRPLDQLDPVAVWVDNERRPEAVLALLAGRDGLDPLGSEAIEGGRHRLHLDHEVAEAG